jgi:hypothetical protein
MAMNTTIAPTGSNRLKGLAVSLILYVGFSALTFVMMGPQPSLGGDHISYIKLADSILGARPAGDYWKEMNSVRNFGVLLSYLHAYTGSHILSMRVILAVVTVFYLSAFELWMSLFTNLKWKRMLFAILSAFAVSFGISSWGVTDSTALLNRTLVMPLIIFAFWFFWRFSRHPAAYLVYSLLVFCSPIHLSTFHIVAILMVLECWDFAVLRKWKVDARIFWFTGGIGLACLTLLALQQTRISTDNVAVVAAMTKGSSIFTAPTDVMSPATAWHVELSLRPWRNMPIPLVNVANMISSYALIGALAVAGFFVRKRQGLTRNDRLMAGLFLSAVVVSFVPQTLMWIVRSFLPVYPINFEEVRALSIIMIPSIYFVFCLFEKAIEPGGRKAIAGAMLIVIAYLALPMFMKSMSGSAREYLLSVATSTGIVNAQDPAAERNARSALGISGDNASPLYYSTENLRKWLDRNARPQTRALTNRDDLVLSKLTLVGSRQSAVVAASTAKAMTWLDELSDAQKALSSGKTEEVVRVAQKYRAELAVIPWRATNAVYSDQFFSVVRIPPVASRSDLFR